MHSDNSHTQNIIFTMTIFPLSLSDKHTLTTAYPLIIESLMHLVYSGGHILAGICIDEWLVQSLCLCSEPRLYCQNQKNRVAPQSPGQPITSTALISRHPLWVTRGDNYLWLQELLLCFSQWQQYLESVDHFRDKNTPSGTKLVSFW